MPATPPPGAHWIRCDLHVHTPFDGEKQFGEHVEPAVAAKRKGDDKPLREIAQRFFDACVRAELGLVGITDHNSADGFAALSPFLAALGRDDRSNGGRAPVFLPGIEFTVGGERPLHFLALFGAETPLDLIRRARDHVFGPRDAFDGNGHPQSTGTSTEEFLRRFHDFCRPLDRSREIAYVLLPAHCDSNKGILKETKLDIAPEEMSLWDELKGHLRELTVTRTDWNGFQMSRTYDKLPEGLRDLLARWFVARRGRDWDALKDDDRKRVRERRHWPLLACSDPGTYEAIGSRYTWLKMETADVEGIRLALMDPESRLRTQDEGEPGAGYPIIASLRVRDTDFFKDVELPLHPSLTTIIGGRGSGKSTVLEYLRYVLNRDRSEELGPEREEGWSTAVHGLLANKSGRDFGQTRGTLLPEHAVTADVRVAGHVYRCVRTARGMAVIPDPDAPGAAPEALDVRRLIEPRILSQRQIAGIAKSPAAQRDELDAMLPEATREFVASRSAAVDRLTALQQARARLLEDIATLPAKETELRVVGDQIAFLEGGNRREVFRVFQGFEAERRWLDDARSSLGTLAGRVEAQAAEIAAEGERLAAAPEGPSARWTAKTATAVAEALKEASAAIQAAATAITAVKDGVENDAAGQWIPSYDKGKEAYLGLQGELRARGMDVAHHQKLVQRREQIRQEVQRLSTLAGRREDVRIQAVGAWDDLVALHKGRAGARAEIAGRLQAEGADILLEVAPLRDREDFARRREEWFPKAGLRDEDWQILVDHVFDAPDVAEGLRVLVAALRLDLEATRRAGRPLTPATSQVASALGERATKLTQHFYRALQNLDRIRIDDMERFVPDDLVRAKVRRPNGMFMPIEQGSFGERATAVLSLLLSAGVQPLIIDQPEDDLDNKYIYDVVVDLLRKRKFSRQIVVATHNANIPVNGDAELIVTLGVRDRLGVIESAGAIDVHVVKEEVSLIMEGSEEAFRLRRERYGY